MLSCAAACRDYLPPNLVALVPPTLTHLTDHLRFLFTGRRGKTVGVSKKRG